MNKTLLDTDIFSEILKGKHVRVMQNAHHYYKYFNRYTISIITVLEIIKGFHKTQREELIQRFLKAISAVEILTLNIWKVNPVFFRIG
jgi:tRNA(fMet)-specific endonuclease VapC